VIVSNSEQCDRGGFPSTHWSLVRCAGLDGETKAAAVRNLIERYRPALRAHLLRSRQLRPEVVDDLLHSFIADKVLVGDVLRHADERRGRFRAFLLKSLNHFAVSQYRAEHAQRRWGGSSAPLDEALAVPATDRESRPDMTFDVEWARALLAQVVQRMRAECRAGGRSDLWGVFEGRVLHPILQHAEPVPYGELAQRYGFVSPAQASNVLTTANRMYVRLLRQVIGVYAKDDAEIDEELRDLREILAAAPRSAPPDFA
jgi:DNA-directed RNA polymerase specialized sigma24 family protein